MAGSPVPGLAPVARSERRWWSGGAFWSTADEIFDYQPKGLSVLLGLVSVAIGGFLVYQGLTDVIQHHALFGIVWTGIAVFAMANTIRLIVRALRR